MRNLPCCNWLVSHSDAEVILDSTQTEPVGGRIAAD